MDNPGRNFAGNKDLEARIRESYAVGTRGGLICISGSQDDYMETGESQVVG